MEALYHNIALILFGFYLNDLLMQWSHHIKLKLDNLPNWLIILL